MVLTILLCAVIAALAFAVGVVVGIRHRPAIVAAMQREAARVVGGPLCQLCGEPANVVRFHDGRYLCPRHKATA